MGGANLMAKGGYAVLDISYSSVQKNIELMIDKVDRGTKKATLAAVQEIYDKSLELVPRETNTLADSAYYEVIGNSKIGFTGLVGYGGNGDPINPISGEHASAYAIPVHEDLTAKHPTGQAKFLERAVLDYQASTLGKYATFLRRETGM